MRKQLTLEQRYEIQALLKANHSKSFIAEQIGVHKATVTREIQRNSGKRTYNAVNAHQYYKERKKDVIKRKRLTDSIKKFIDAKIRQEWSPEQIVGHCKRYNIEMVSHETIYQHIYSDQIQGGTLYTHLRTARPKRKPKHNKKKGRFTIKDRVFISQRPKIVDSKQRYGDWEVDTIIGANRKGAILGVVERKSMFALYVRRL